MTKYKSLLIILLFSFSCFAQKVDKNPESTGNQFSVNLLIPSLEWEVALGDSSSIDLLLGTAFGLAKNGNESDIGFFPQFQSQYRYYYNYERRREKGRNTADNSANYWMLSASLRSGNPIIGELDIADEYAGLIGPGWGMQRVYGGGFKLNFNTGLGFGFNDLGDQYFTPFIGIQLGWLIAR